MSLRGRIVFSNITFNSSDIGKKIYLSDTTAGKYTLDLPSSGNVVIVGTIINENQILFDPQYRYSI